MDDLIETGAGNAHEFTVSEISGAVKRALEDQFGRVRVRGEIGRVSRPGSGHLYFDLKDDRAVIAAVTWKAQVARLGHRPEEGLEVIATGRLTTFPGQSKYQLIVEHIEPAGVGALMAVLDQRRRALAAEGLFDEARKQPLPFLPEVIAVVTSPSGAVIRDILHRLRDRFPTRVLLWPVAVQGRDCAAQVAAAIRGLNAMAPGGPSPRPDLIIVARGGGSLEDLWGFNEEAVVRAAAESGIPLISAVGHETDTTLIDFAAARRAPTPTAAAEMAVPVRADLAARMAEAGARMARAGAGRVALPRQRLRDLSRALGRPGALVEAAEQRLDLTGARLDPALRARLGRAGDRLAAAPVRPGLLRSFQLRKSEALAALQTRLAMTGRAASARAGTRLAAARLSAQALARAIRQRRAALDGLASRLHPALLRQVALMRRDHARDAQALAALGGRLQTAAARRMTEAAARIGRLDRIRRSLGHEQTLRRGFAIVRGPDGVITTAREAARTPRMDIEFADGRVAVRPERARGHGAPAADQPAGQKSLF